MTRIVPLLLLLLVGAAGAGGPSREAGPSQALAPAGTGSKVWLGREAEFERYLRTAPIHRVEDVPVGVTRPQRAFFAEGGLAGSAVFKALPPGQREGFFESHKSEIAAYELDKLLGLGMVPPTVARRVGGRLGSLQLWVERCVLLKTVDPNGSPDIAAWNRQVYRQRVWDNLTGNIDRNQGNLLVDPAWNLILIDHSRAFTATPEMPFTMTRIDRELHTRLKTLSAAEVGSRLGKLLFDGPRPVMERRDAILAHFERLIAEKGEAAVLIP